MFKPLHNGSCCAGGSSALSPIHLYEAIGDDVRDKSIIGTQEMIDHIWSFGQVGAGVVKHEIFPLVLPHDGIEITKFSPIFLVQTRTGPAHDVL